ncbi:MAG: hypothetical protein QME05_06885, partial [Candidatus Margulisbacteria bacterium]|nr:hypothetical protein [Candidatus Margulisiibacteriota bacterium]
MILKGFQVLLFSLLILSPGYAESLPIAFQPIPGQLYFASQHLAVDAAEFDTFVIRINAQQSGAARLFWANNYDPQFNQPKSTWFFLKKGEHSYYFNFPSQNLNWVGWTTGFIFFPEMNPNLTEIKQAQLISGNWLTASIAGWQEFWGPKGRLIIGSTINTIQSPTLFGRSIFVYIYWILAFAAIIFLCCRIFLWSKEKKKTAFYAIWLETGRITFFAIIAIWVLLEISSLFNNWLALKDDWKYVGKNYRDKLVIANTGDFYSFIEFCEKNIPLGAKYDMRIPPVYN